MTRIPLFPLSTLLYPGCSLPLQIFEQRYLELVSRSLKNQQGFGIVPIKTGREVGQVPEIYQAGTYVRITDWDQLANGLLGITVTAERRFRVLYADAEPNQLMHGDVEWLEDNDDLPLIDEFSGLRELRETLLQHPGAEIFQLPELNDSLARLTWQLGQLLPVGDDDKLELLLSASPLRRIELIASWLERLGSD